ncbi:hypothetical protein [Aquimarina algicola]|uniref:DUF1330 domain-containing protein n=1 Tax=Aquimarina algicola TaxID=2589995 RepID=A0A504IYA8_9FLAO|nr:hypothetical protein [Aquimarina algicola]TPN83477.1 hypothetical protein FHK87_19865 [Aquimarina algicola]
MRILILTVYALSLLCTSITAQENVKTYTLKRGEVLDILLLSTVSNSETLFDKYKKTAFPVAFEYSYKPLPGFAIRKRVFGSASPSTFIFGKWDNKSKREGFLNNIAKRVPDFHQQRNDLFPHFELVYYEMSKDTKFSIHKDQHTVVTTLWQKDKNDFETLFSQWKKDIVQSGGKVVLQLKDGYSPIGYEYNPDVLVIAEWEDEIAFQKFKKEYPLERFTALQDIHQFVLN